MTPTGTAHWNRVPVSVLLTLICNQPELLTGAPGTSFRTLTITGKTTRSRYICNLVMSETSLISIEQVSGQQTKLLYSY